MANPRATATEENLLQALREYDPPGAWARPMDLGGSDASNHSRVLAKLVRLGLVERKSRSGRGSFVYRIQQSQEAP